MPGNRLSVWTWRLCYNAGMRFPDLVYGLVFLAGFPLWIARCLRREQRRHLRSRFSPGPLPPATRRIWIHAVSVGEVRAVADLARRAGAAFSLPVVLTVTTLSGYRQARKVLEDIPVIPAPLDFSFVIKRYLKHLAPGLLLLNELEVWPNWTRLLKERGVPMVVANARMSDDAFRRYQRFRRLLAPSFRRPDAWLVQSAAYAPRLIELGVPADRIRVGGNIKADQALAAAGDVPDRETVLAHLHAREPRRPLVVLASTHEEDENVLLPALAALETPPAVIIAPRHPKRTPAICRKLERLNIPFSVWSHASAVDLDRGVLVYDRIGYLTALMSVADAVFMGGTFSPRTGGHNLYEPAALAKSLWGGPHFNNFPEVGKALVEAGAYQVVPDTAAAAAALARCGKEDGGSGERARMVVESRRGTTDHILEEMRRWLHS